MAPARASLRSFERRTLPLIKLRVRARPRRAPRDEATACLRARPRGAAIGASEPLVRPLRPDAPLPQALGILAVASFHFMQLACRVPRRGGTVITFRLESLMTDRDHSPLLSVPLGCFCQVPSKRAPGILHGSQAPLLTSHTPLCLRYTRPDGQSGKLGAAKDTSERQASAHEGPPIWRLNAMAFDAIT